MGKQHTGATRAKKKVNIVLPLFLRNTIKHAVSGVLVVSCLVAVGYALLQWLNKPVAILQVTAPLVHITESQIKEKLVSIFPSSFFYLDVEDVRTLLLEMPMARQVKVKKVWPDTLELELLEEQPVATWNNDKTLSQDGDVLPVKFEGLELPQLQGEPDQRQSVMHHYHLFNQWGKGFGLSWYGVKHSLAGWELHGNGGLTVWLDADDAMESLQRLGIVISKLNIEDISSIDLRYEQGFAVSWRPLESKGLQLIDEKENEA